MVDVTHLFFEFLANIKYAHLLSKTYTEHKATDKLYNSIDDLYDKFLEVYIGIYGVKNIKTKKHINLNAHNGNISQYIKTIIKKIDLIYKKQDNDLKSILDEMKIEINQCLYILNLLDNRFKSV